MNNKLEEALEILETISKEEIVVRDRSSIYMNPNDNGKGAFTHLTTVGVNFKGAIETIKQALLKAQEQDVVIEHINESYKALCQHIEINEKYVELKKYRDIVELSKISYDIALSKEQKGLCEKYFTWLKKDRSE